MNDRTGQSVCRDRRRRVRSMTVIASAMTVVACLALTACTPSGPPPLDANTLLEIQQLKNTNARLEKQLRRRDEQIATLQDLGDKRLGELYTVQRIKLASGTGGIRKDGMPGDEAVRVNVSPIDQYGSTLKAAGRLTVQVFDLDAPEAHNLLTECTLDPNQAAKKWTGGLLGSYYSIICPLKTPPAHRELTVRATFVEYLTGKTFTTQDVIEIDLPPKPETQPATKPGT